MSENMNKKRETNKDKKLNRKRKIVIPLKKPKIRSDYCLMLFRMEVEKIKKSHSCLTKASPKNQRKHFNLIFAAGFINALRSIVTS